MDYNEDGWLDIFSVHSGERVYAWQNNGVISPNPYTFGRRIDELPTIHPNLFLMLNLPI